MAFPLLESLAIDNGIILNARWHEARYAKAYQEYYGLAPEFGLLENITLDIPTLGYFKLRIAYNKTEHEVELTPYHARHIKTLKVVDTQQLDYHLKYTDRTRINELYALRDDADDILIVNNGMVSDTSIANLVFLNNRQWYTPATPLLAGTQRAKLLHEKVIIEKTITKEELKTFEAFQMINALRPFDPQKASSVKNILF